MRQLLKSKIVATMALLICGISGLMAQSKDRTHIPHFEIQQIDGKMFSYQQLSKGKSLILIYFSPDCEHCSAFTKAILQQADYYRKKQIVMICWEPVAQLRQFSQGFDFQKLPNLVMGTEGYSFLVQQFYQVAHFPFVAMFNKDGQLVKKIENQTNIPLLITKMHAVNE